MPPPQAPPPCYERQSLSLSVGLVYMAASIFGILAFCICIAMGYFYYKSLLPPVRVLGPEGAELKLSSVEKLAIGMKAGGAGVLRLEMAAPPQERSAEVVQDELAMFEAKVAELQAELTKMKAE